MLVVLPHCHHLAIIMGESAVIQLLSCPYNLSGINTFPEACCTGSIKDTVPTHLPISHVIVKRYSLHEIVYICYPRYLGDRSQKLPNAFKVRNMSRGRWFSVLDGTSRHNPVEVAIAHRNVRHSQSICLYLLYTTGTTL